MLFAMSADTPNPVASSARSPLVRLRGEEPRQHRAFLLWTLLGDNRNASGAHQLLASIAKIPPSTLRTWRTRWEWEHRYQESPDPEADAFLLYQDRYLRPSGASALVRLAESVVAPLGVLSQIDREMLKKAEAEPKAPPTKPANGGGMVTLNPATRPPPAAETRPKVVSGGRPPKTTEKVAKVAPASPPPELQRAPDPSVTARVTEALGLTEPRAVQAEVVAAPVPPRVESEEEKRRKAAARDMQLLDGALGYSAKALQEGKVPVTLAGIATLIKTKRLLLGQSTENVLVGQVPAGGPAPMTARMRAATDEDSKLAAMIEDVEDIRTILQGLAAAREVRAATVTTEARKLA